MTGNKHTKKAKGDFGPMPPFWLNDIVEWKSLRKNFYHITKSDIRTNDTLNEFYDKLIENIENNCFGITEQFGEEEEDEEFGEEEEDEHLDQPGNLRDNKDNTKDDSAPQKSSNVTSANINQLEVADCEPTTDAFKEDAADLKSPETSGASVGRIGPQTQPQRNSQRPCKLRKQTLKDDLNDSVLVAAGIQPETRLRGGMVVMIPKMTINLKVVPTRILKTLKMS